MKRLAVACAAMLTMLAAACGGAEPQELPRLVGAEASRLVDAGDAYDLTTIDVRFDRPVEFREDDIPFESHIELLIPVPDLLTGEESRERAFVQDAIPSPDDPSLVTLTVRRTVPGSSTLNIAGAAFDDDSDEILSIEVDSDVSPLGAVLASTPLATTNGTLFDEGVAAQVTEADRDPAAMRAALQDALVRRGVSQEALSRAVQTYDLIPADVVTSPKLRAALAGLVGTFAEPAIADLMSGENCTGQPVARVAFEEPPEAPEFLGRVTYTESGARVLSIRPDLEGERIEHLMPLLAHEAIHCDQSDGRFEEIAATALDTYLYINLLAADPTLADARTPLARELNIDVIAAINSGGRYPESIGVLPQTSFELALPGTTADFDSFADLVAAAYPQILFNSSPDERLAQAYVTLLAEAAGYEVGSAFDLRYLEELLARTTRPEVIISAIITLELEPFTEP